MAPYSHFCGEHHEQPQILSAAVDTLAEDPQALRKVVHGLKMDLAKAVSQIHAIGLAAKEKQDESYA